MIRGVGQSVHAVDYLGRSKDETNKMGSNDQQLNSQYLQLATTSMKDMGI